MFHETVMRDRDADSAIGRRSAAPDRRRRLGWEIGSPGAMQPSGTQKGREYSEAQGGGARLVPEALRRPCRVQPTTIEAQSPAPQSPPPTGPGSPRDPLDELFGERQESPEARQAQGPECLDDRGIQAPRANHVSPRPRLQRPPREKLHPRELRNSSLSRPPTTLAPQICQHRATGRLVNPTRPCPGPCPWVVSPAGMTWTPPTPCVRR